MRSINIKHVNVSRWLKATILARLCVLFGSDERFTITVIAGELIKHYFVIIAYFYCLIGKPECHSVYITIMMNNSLLQHQDSRRRLS